MPGAVARTSAFALNNATLPFVLKLANLGAEAAMKADPHLANGLNVSAGKIRHAGGGRGARRGEGLGEGGIAAESNLARHPLPTLPLKGGGLQKLELRALNLTRSS
jgi:hypothetical protein